MQKRQRLNDYSVDRSCMTKWRRLSKTGELRPKRNAGWNRLKKKNLKRKQQPRQSVLNANVPRNRHNLQNGKNKRNVNRCKVKIAVVT